MAAAAEFPDIDTVSSLRGPVSGFEHHRGITHTFVGIPIEAALLVGFAWAFHRLRTRRSHNATGHHVPERAPVRWGLLYGLAILALLSHLLLDYTNNYGVRPFFPFNPRWYAGSFVFILDPLMLVLLIGGLVLPSLLGLVKQEIGAKKERFPGAFSARAALFGVVCLWGVRVYAHQQALGMAGTQTLRAPVQASEEQATAASPSNEQSAARAQRRPLLSPVRSWASPDPLNPFRWYVASDFGQIYELASVESRSGVYSAYRLLNKPAMSPCLRAAKESRLGQVYLDWSPMPWISVSQAARSSTPGEAPQGDSVCTVRFEDPRFMSSSPLLNRGQEPPLTGVVKLNTQNQVLLQEINGRVER